MVTYIDVLHGFSVQYCFVCSSLQADPLFGLLGFGGGMDFDSDKAYRSARDISTSFFLFYYDISYATLIVCENRTYLKVFNGNVPVQYRV